MRIVRAFTLAATAMTFSHLAAATVPTEAGRLGQQLTPVGAEAGPNGDGSIPAWTGGETKAPPCFKGPGARYCDPYAGDKPLYTITAANAGQYKARLSAGQMELLRRYSGYQMPVYATRRSFANPQYVYDATRGNATTADLTNGGNDLSGAAVGVPFPMPKSGAEVIWNHKLRYRGVSMTRWNNQFAVNVNGNYNMTHRYEDYRCPYSQEGATPESLNNLACYFMMFTLGPPRLAGEIGLVHETMDQVKEPRRTWLYNAGQRRLRRAPDVAYDSPGSGSDGLRTNDQFDMFNGAMDRYDWKLVGKREMYVPANSYELHSDTHKYKDIVKAGHISQRWTRYELRRMWVVEANLRPNTSHIYKKRVFFVDEDGWQIRLVDVYDNRDQLWRFQEAHSVMAYDLRIETPVAEVLYDFQSGRYLAQAMNNEDSENMAKTFPDNYFDPASVSKKAFK